MDELDEIERLLFRLRAQNEQLEAIGDETRKIIERLERGDLYGKSPGLQIALERHETLKSASHRLMESTKTLRDEIDKRFTPFEWMLKEPGV